jgi:hemerythrin-like domain-containing protein
MSTVRTDHAEGGTAMDAIKYLTQQHREMDALFEKFENASKGAKKTKLQVCREVSDLLAVHATIEEKIFYPAAKDARTEEMLQEAVEEHLSMKRIIADLVELDEIDDEAEAKMSVLREQKKHHVEEEDKELFPKARKLLDADELRELGEKMEEMAEELMAAGAPRMQVPNETDEAARI